MSKYVELAQSLYLTEGEDRKFPYYLSGYQSIIEHFGTVAVQVEDSDYQGDSRILYADTGKGFGYLNFGWGSCSGCDALQACESWEDVGELIKQLEAQVQWKSKAEMLTFFKEHDWEGDYCYHADEQKKFIEQAIAYLESV